MRRLVVLLLSLAVLLVVADVGLRIVSEYWVGGELQKSLGLPGRPDVSLHGEPYLFEVASGDVPSVFVRTGTWTVHGLRLRSATMTLQDVHFSPRQLVYGRRSTIRAASGTGVAVIETIDVTATILGQQATIHVQFQNDQALIRSNHLKHAVRATVSVNGNNLVVRSDDPLLGGSLSLALPQLVTGLQYQDARIVGSSAEVAFRLVRPRFEVGV